MNNDDNYDMNDILPGKSRNKHKKILDKLKEIEDDEYTNFEGYNNNSFLPSTMLSEEDKKTPESEEQQEEDADKWFHEMVASSNIKINKSSRPRNNMFDETGIFGKKKKKKKKDKNKNELVDFKKEFEPEMALYKNLLVDQNRFTDTLQKEYDAIKSVKSTSRGVNKQMSDLIENITSARALSMQLIEKNVNAKKLIADLTIKQKKEMGGDSNAENMTDYAATYLKQMLNERQNLFNNGTGDSTVSEYTEDEMFNSISNTLDSDESMNRPEEVDKYLKYENRNVNVYVTLDKSEQDIENNYQFVAKDEDGETIYDYPLPIHTKISVNRSTNVATDIYGKKYTIIWD